MDVFKNKNGKLLRCGYTTGSCAAAAAKAAADALLRGWNEKRVSIGTPRGVVLILEVDERERGADFVSCAVKKDSGDDPDSTDGIWVVATVRKRVHGIEIDGGEGVGRVTRPGLDQPVGAAAINSVPRRMIREELKAVCEKHGYSGGFEVCISIPQGRALARRTFNPKMGIEGGISVIGTSGIVEPMSSEAMMDTVRLELKQLAAAGEREVLLTPGNYGETFARQKLGLSMRSHVNCSNFIGAAIDTAVENGFIYLLLVGHIGKLVKLGIGVLNTHSSFGDGRMETLSACALRAGADTGLLKGIMECVSTDAALQLLENSGLLNGAMRFLGERIEDCLRRRVPDGVKIGYVCFTNAPPMAGVLALDDHAREFVQRWRKLK